jgi:hypothetical protein
MEIWRPKAGELIQIWDRVEMDHPDDPSATGSTIRDHGELAYIVRESKKTDEFTGYDGKKRFLAHITEGEVFKCIKFGPGDSVETIHVHLENMRHSKHAKKAK